MTHTRISSILMAGQSASGASKSNVVSVLADEWPALPTGDAEDANVRTYNLKHLPKGAKNAWRDTHRTAFYRRVSHFTINGPGEFSRKCRAIRNDCYDYARLRGRLSRIGMVLIREPHVSRSGRARFGPAGILLTSPALVRIRRRLQRHARLFSKIETARIPCEIDLPHPRRC